MTLMLPLSCLCVLAPERCLRLTNLLHARVFLLFPGQHAGLSFRSAAAAVIPARGRAVVPTDLAIACPPGTYARIAPRSGLAVKHFIDTGGDDSTS